MRLLNWFSDSHNTGDPKVFRAMESFLGETFRLIRWLFQRMIHIHLGMFGDICSKYIHYFMIVCFDVCVCVLAYRHKRGNTETLTTGRLQMVRLYVIFLFCIYQWPVFFFLILQYKRPVSCWCLKDKPQKKKKRKKKRKKENREREKKETSWSLICNVCQFPWCKHSHYGSF